MGKRLDLQKILEAVLGSGNVYFQPPINKEINYPCIVYKRSSEDTKFANDRPYLNKKCYQVTVIDYDPDSEIPDKILKLPECTFANHFTKENLNHDIYNLYF